MIKKIQQNNKHIKGMPGSTFRSRKTTAGFSIVEVLIAITIILAIGTVSIFSFLNWRSAKKIETGADTVLSVLKEARNLSVSGKESSSYGVYFGDTDRVVLFKGESYNSGLIVSTAYLPSGTIVSTSTLGTSVFFKRLSGNANGNGIIIVKDNSNASNTRTINIEVTGSLSTI